MNLHLKKRFFIIVFTIMLFCVMPMSAQLFKKDPIIYLENFDKKRVHFGYYFGINYYDFKFIYKEIIFYFKINK